jgi:hypothetical protein
MTIRKISLDGLKGLVFAKNDIFDTFIDRYDRVHKLRSAMAYTSGNHDEVWLIVILANGEAVEVESNIIDLEDDYVELQNGIGIPVVAIYDVGV